MDSVTHFFVSACQPLLPLFVVVSEHGAIPRSQANRKWRNVMKKTMITVVSLLTMALLSAPVLAADVSGRGWVKGQGAARGSGVFKGTGTASGTGVVIYRDNNGHVRYKKGTGTVSGRGIAIGRGGVAGSGKGAGRGRVVGPGKGRRF
jgi:hypothetical protein